MRRIVNTLVLLITPLLLMCGSSDATQGECVLVINLESQDKTLLPDISMEIVSYRVSGSGPDGAVLAEQNFSASQSQVSLTGLASGTWTITAAGLNAGGVTIGNGSGTVIIKPGSEAILSISVRPLDGNGVLSLTTTWNPSLVSNPVISATLTPAGGSAGAITFTINATQGNATYTGSGIAAGYYTLNVRLYDNTTLMSGFTESVRIVTGETTLAVIPFTIGNVQLNYIADYTVAKDSVLRQIPDAYINTARTTLRIAYFHTSHGTHVSYGLFGLPGFKAGDDVKFGITNNSTRDANKLDFHDCGPYGVAASPYPDLSQADLGSWTTWMNQVRTYLDDPANSGINVMMWSWCDITGHSVSNYLNSMQIMINEYGPGGSKIGTGSGQTRTTPVTFIFMTGHAVRNANTGSGYPKNQAQLIIDYCNAHNYYCIDYYSIDTRTMDDVYYEDTGDDGDSTSYGGNFYLSWQNSHTLGTHWYYNRTNPGGSVEYGVHNTQHITANRKAFAAWYIFARIAGWDGSY